MKKLIKDSFELYLQVALQGMSELPDKSFDLAICDPPYGAATSAKWNYDGNKKINGFGGNWKLNSEEWDLLTGNEEILLKWSYFIRDVEFRKCDYRETLADANKNDFVFLDPPYGGTKDRYTKTEFNLSEFYNELERLNSVGAKWILTFDGTAGNRQYNYQLPKELFKHRTEIKTGNSPFTKSMRTSIDAVYESVYFNFQPIVELRNNVRKNTVQELKAA